MTQISIGQWQALRAQGYSEEQIKGAGYTLAVPAPVAMPVHNGNGGAAPVDFAGTDYGVNEGRKPEDGRHIVDLELLHLYNGNFGGKVVVKYTLVESTNPQNEIGGTYSKTYPTQRTERDYGKGKAALKAFVGDLLDHLTPGLNARGLSDPDFNAKAATVIARDSSGSSGAAKGVRFLLRTETRRTEAGDFVHHEWRVVPPGSTLSSLGFGGRGSAPVVTLPPMPPPSAPAGVPPMPAGLPPMPSAPANDGRTSGDGRPTGWVGPWPPQGAA